VCLSGAKRRPSDYHVPCATAADDQFMALSSFKLNISSNVTLDDIITSLQRSKMPELTGPCQDQVFRQMIENADDIRLDVPLYMACRVEVQRFCKKVELGSSHVKDCLENHREHPKFSSECKREFEEMMTLRARHYQLDPELKSACASEIKTICGVPVENIVKGIRKFDEHVILCLKDAKKQIKGECHAAMHKIFEREGADIRMDKDLDECYQDKEAHCGQYPPGSARVIQCLQDNRNILNSQCRKRLLELEMEIAEDIDFQYPLKMQCAAELKVLCKDVKKGHARAIRCLQDNVDSRNMGPECRVEVRRNMRIMSLDYRLNYRLKTACEGDIATVCSGACHAIVAEECGGTVLNCLRDNMEKLQGAKCKEEVRYFVKMEVSDIQTDVQLAEECRSDMEKFCKDVEPGDGRHIECLRKNR
jgi:golgi apparatus protein 1